MADSFGASASRGIELPGCRSLGSAFKDLVAQTNPENLAKNVAPAKIVYYCRLLP
jgi:hypothetical protein